jgi:ankyrin repeat protein
MRPLRVGELAEILAVDFNAARQGGIPRLNPDWRWADQHQAVLSTCSSLITIVNDGDSQVVQFSHFSVKEFLTSDRLAHSSEDVSRYHILLETAHTLIAQACLGVLLRLDDDVDSDNAKDIPLAEYAARYWIDHAQFGKVSSHIRETMEFLFDTDKPHWAAWIRVYNIDAYWEFYSPDGLNDAFPLYYASLCGFYNLVEYLIGKYPEHVSAHGGRLVTPLVAALFKEHLQVAELLFQHGADVDVRGSSGNTPLTTACSIGPEDVVPWLLNHGTDVNSPKTGGYTSLHLAAFHAQLKSVEALLEHGADINARNLSGEVPLHLSACPFTDPRLYQPNNLSSHRLKDRYRSHLAIVQLLLNYGADANTRDNTGSTPLHHSSCSNSTSIRYGTTEGANLLLKHGANIDAKDNDGRTPLQIALVYERHEMARFFSERGAT